MTGPQRPLPQPSALTEGFWLAAAEGRLVAQRCADCDRWRHYPQERCPGCHSDSWRWSELTGAGEIYSLSVAHRAFHPAWAERVPYTVVTVELDEGVRMVSDLPDADGARAAIGDRVEVFFDRVGGETVLPRFRLARS